MGAGGASGAGGGGYGYYGNVPASMYGLLLGACRLGLEPLVYHTLKVQNMSKISGEQLQKAFTCSQEHGHQNLANCLKHLVRFTTFVTRYVWTQCGSSCTSSTVVKTGEGQGRVHTNILLCVCYVTKPML